MRKILEQRKGQAIQLTKQLESLKSEIASDTKLLIRHEKAREIIREVGKITQEQIQFHISDITSLALEAVFPDPYKLELEFVQRRNKTECDIYFSRDGNRCDPLDSSGYGAVDVASFALRIASWSLEIPHSRNVIILDEPMKWVSKEYREKASYMIKEISKKLQIQFIIVSHDPVLTAFADKTFEINKNKKKVSEIKSY